MSGEAEKPSEDNGTKGTYLIVGGVIIGLILVSLLGFGCMWRASGKKKKSSKSGTDPSIKKSNTRTKASTREDVECGESKSPKQDGGSSDIELTQNPGGSGRPAWRSKKEPKPEPKKEPKPDPPVAPQPSKARVVKYLPAPRDDDFFATPAERLERQAAEVHVPVPVPPGSKDPFLVVTDQECTGTGTGTGAGAAPESDPKTSRLSGPIANQVFGVPTIPEDVAAADAAAPPAAPAVADASAPAAGAAGAAAAPAASENPTSTSKQPKEEEIEKEEENSHAKSTKSEKGDDSDPKKKGKNEKKKIEPKKKDDKKDKKKSGKKDKKKESKGSAPSKKPKYTPKKKKVISKKPKKVAMKILKSVDK